MTSQAYAQDVTQESHIALMRSKLLQQMQAPAADDQSFARMLNGTHLPNQQKLNGGEGYSQQSLRVPGQGFSQHSVRGSGHHHYLPTAGEHPLFHHPEHEC